MSDFFSNFNPVWVTTLAAIVSPVIVAWINARRDVRMKKLELSEKGIKSTAMSFTSAYALLKADNIENTYLSFLACAYDLLMDTRSPVIQQKIRSLLECLRQQNHVTSISTDQLVEEIMLSLAKEKPAP